MLKIEAMPNAVAAVGVAADAEVVVVVVV